MAMESLAAAGLAGNILQFVDFASKLLSGARDLYLSVHGAKQDNLESEALAKHIIHLVAEVQPPKHTLGVRLSQDVELLSDLSTQCFEVSNELLSILNSLKVKGVHRSWESFHKAFRSEWKKDHINALHQRLELISAQIRDHIFENRYLTIMRTLHNLGNENKRLLASRDTEIAEIRKIFEQHSEEHEAEITSEDSRENTGLHLSAINTRGRQYFAEQTVLNFLRFTTIDDNLIQVAATHDRTYE